MAANDLPWRSWFEQHRAVMIEATGHCDRELQGLLHQNTTGCPEDYHWSTKKVCTVKVLIDCLMSDLSESVKVSMASGAILLGLLPATLALLGSTTLELGILYLKRPLLAGILSIGSPSISPIRTFTYDDPRELLTRPTRSTGFPSFNPLTAGFLSALEYFCAILAAGNVCHVVVSMGYKAVSSIASEIPWMPPFWVAGSLLVYMLGLVTVKTCIDLQEVAEDGEDERKQQWWLQRAARGFRREWILCGRQRRSTLEYAPESHTFTVMSWLTSTLTVIHIIFGTVVFSGILFVGPNDAIKIGLRISASTLLSRIVLMCELYGIRARLVGNSCGEEGEKLGAAGLGDGAGEGLVGRGDSDQGYGGYAGWQREEKQKGAMGVAMDDRGLQHRVSRKPVPSRKPSAQSSRDVGW